MIIGIGHQRGVGKDVAAEFMVKEFQQQYPSIGRSIKHASFAEPLYELCEKYYGWAGFKSAKYYDSHRVEKEEVLTKLGKSPRQILIEMGMKVREIIPSTWVDYAMHQDHEIVIFSDMRFPNEAKAIRDAGGRLVLITRPGLPEVTDPNDPDNQLSDFDDWDYHIVNDGSMKDYEKQIASFVEALKE